MKPNNRLEIHFLNVDHGDCTIIRHPGDEHRQKGRVSFVDINDWKGRKNEEEEGEEETVAGLDYFMNAADATTTKSVAGLQYQSQISREDYAEEYLDDPIDYFSDEVAQFGQDVWRFVSTHPDMDHLSGLDRLCDETSISVFWDTAHKKGLDIDSNWPDKYDPDDWEKYTQIRDGETDHQHLQPTRGSEKQYWKQDSIDILHPSPGYVTQLNIQNEDEDRPKYNDISYVLKLNTRGGAILLPGDAEEDAWERILDHWGSEILEDVRILKAPHHGRKDGFHKEAVEAMDPEYVIVSVGKKPTTDAYQDYRRVCSDDTKIISTRQHGTVQATCFEHGAMIVTMAEPDGIFDLPSA